tara:strand:+ start:764 stop:913 length:150 start_codon:yes stop_codon:yes gene_type:complete
MYTIYEEHIEVLEEENKELKQQLTLLKRELLYYREDEKNDDSWLYRGTY